MADGELFRHRDLHVIDVIAVPDRLEQSIGETQHEDVLHRFLAEIMIDAVNLMLVENLEQLLVEAASGSEIGAERLLDDDAPPRAILLAREPRLAKLAADRGKGGGRRR